MTHDLHTGFPAFLCGLIAGLVIACAMVAMLSFISPSVPADDGSMPPLQLATQPPIPGP